jgi:hypothetical protein
MDGTQTDDHANGGSDGSLARGDGGHPLPCCGRLGLAPRLGVPGRGCGIAAPQVRVQIERQQRAITDGPYRIVRHPMYAGALLMFVGTPLLLGSWWGLLFVPLGALGIGLRAVGEERMLSRELAGYEEYTRHVRFRMVPGLW